LELFAGRESGVRITVEIPREPGQLAKLTKAVFELGGDILALGTYLGESSDTGKVTMKVDGIKKDDLVKALTPMVIRILDARVTPVNNSLI
jgi:acetoin utilization protein AcuB